MASQTKIAVKSTIKSHTQVDTFDKKGACQMKCTSCLLKYMGKWADHLMLDRRNMQE
jgi:hypothetical protein